jgi:uncharacterized membrane protein
MPSDGLPPRPPEPALEPEAKLTDVFGLERLVFFSDAVMAIAITLLALDIRLPPLEDHDSRELTQALLGLWPRYLSFFLSFLVIASYWLAHHNIFRVVRSYDRRFMWLNLLFLLCIVAIPFASSVIGEHGNQSPAAILYALVITMTGLVETCLWLYATWRHRLVDPALPPGMIRSWTVSALTPPLVFLVSIPLALINPYLAQATWYAIFPIMAVARRVQMRATGSGPDDADG